MAVVGQQLQPTDGFCHLRADRPGPGSAREAYAHIEYGTAFVITYSRSGIGLVGCPKGFPEQKKLGGLLNLWGLLNWNVLYRLDALPVTQPTACMLTAQRVG